MKKKKKICSIINIFSSIMLYAIILIIMEMIFKKNFYLDNSFNGIWGVLAASIIYLLNIFIKPLLILLSLPITAFTLGLSLPFVNVIILKITDVILGEHFEIHGLLTLFLIAVLVTFMYKIISKMIINPILKGRL